MDFFQAQRSAHQRTRLLVLLFTAAVVLVVSANYLAVHLVLLFGVERRASTLTFPDATLLAGVAAVTLVVIAGGTAYRTVRLRRGGPAVAELVGGRAVEPRAADPAERRLLNVVEEMAIASGIPVPAVYVLDADGINAFAAGLTIPDAAVAVTRGALERLDRDELQGVVAHEFSHILNGDMRLNVRLIGLLYGILLIAVIGREILEGRRYSSRRRDGGAAVLLAVALIVIGYVGVVFGRIIKAAISRQREFLADASAVQFTRNPDGIAGALKKIGAHAAGSRVRAGHVEELSHLFLADALGRHLWATHPPLAERIRRIDPNFDGEFPAAEPVQAQVGPVPASREIRDRLADVDAAATAGIADVARGGPAAGDVTGTAGTGRAAEGAGTAGELSVALEAGELMSSIGSPTAAHVSRAARLLESIPPELDAAARTAGGAQALLLALLIDADAEVADRQRELVRRRHGEELLDWIDDLTPHVRAQPREARLALLDLALPSLGRLPPHTAAIFRATVHELIRADRRVRLFEHALVHTLSRHLPTANGRPVRRGPTLHSLAPLREDVEVVLSAVARSGAVDEAAIRTAFEAGAASLPGTVGEMRLHEPEAVRVARIERGLASLGRGSLGVRRRFLNACARCIAHDGRVRPSEAELLRAIAAGLDCPMPPLVAGEGTAPRAVAAG